MVKNAKSCILDKSNLIKWILEPSILNTPQHTKTKKGNKSIFDTLFEKVEYAGRFKIIAEKKCDSGVCKKSVSMKLDKLNGGSSSSVSTSDGYCNFHTHPVACYNGENTIWGWPSGEDMRETIGFNIRNNLYHLVFTMEGIYMIQVNPNFIAPFNELHDEVKGSIIGCIEAYFKSTHGHRTAEYNKTFGTECDFSSTGNNSEKWGICMPDDWVNFANNFTLKNLIKTRENKCSELLPCNGVPDYNNHKTGTIDVTHHHENYTVENYKCSKNGHLSDSSDHKGHAKTIENIGDLANKFEGIPTTMRYGDEEWKKGQWFNCKLFYNEFKCSTSEQKYNSFEDWMTSCIRPINTSIKNAQELVSTIRSYWEACMKNHDLIRFNETEKVYIVFKSVIIPEGKTMCELVHGTGTLDEFEEDTHDTHTKKHKNPKNPKKKV